MILYLLSLFGVWVFAISGSLTAAREDFDLMGISVVAVVTAIGGGTIRDVLLDRNPVFWIADPWYLWVALCGVAFTFVYVRFNKPPDATLLIMDALGLALFSISGTQLAEQQNLPPIISVVMGAITGVAGGVLRDVLCAEVPILFRRDEVLYATAAICGSATYLVLHSMNADRTVAALFGLCVTAGLRFAAIYWKIKLPVLNVRHLD